ncbi:MAG TPA: subclass B3 metallo-beta-lactamase [Cyclobacteriaceae bacterium]|nr:subclass B3 metallo-beta-lactamase [Cyclobacteriaceae bacterium]
MMRLTFSLVAFLLIAGVACAQNIVEPQGPADWTKPYPPFRIVGNVYYVGTYDLACYLVTTPQGNILINTGLASSAATIKSNVEALGFRMNDIKILLTTQAHHDHVGAMSAIKKMTGAKLMVNEKDASVLADGGKSDYAFGGNNSAFEPMKSDRLLHDGDTIRLADTQLVMLDHPGHTKGSSSYMLTIESYRVLIVNMPTIVISKKFSEIQTYPGIAKDYARTLSALKELKFDIWLSSHAAQFSMHSKHKPGDKYDPTVFIDQKGYDKAVKNLQSAFDKKLGEK